MLKSIGIIGHGHFGQFLEVLATRFLPEATVRIHSQRQMPGTERFHSLASAAASDVVILAGSISEYEAQLQTVLPHVRPETIVVDVATVKGHTNSLFKEFAVEQPYLCCHPMFGPESYEKCGGDVSGFRIVFTNTTLPRVTLGRVREFLSDLGFKVIEMTADEHDRLLAETLFLTHYIAQTMKAGEFGRTDIDTVSFNSLMNSVESVQDDAKLFADVYRYNPYCKEVAERFHDAQQQVYQSVQNRSNV